MKLRPRACLHAVDRHVFMPLASVHVKELAHTMYAMQDSLIVAAQSERIVTYVLHRCHQCHKVKQVSLLLQSTGMHFSRYAFVLSSWARATSHILTCKPSY